MNHYNSSIEITSCSKEHLTFFGFSVSINSSCGFAYFISVSPSFKTNSLAFKEAVEILNTKLKSIYKIN